MSTSCAEQASNDYEPSAPALPIPPRFRWLKRFAKAALALVLFAVLFRLWWGYEAHRRLQAEIDSYRAAGQLVYAEEFDAELDAVQDDQNAAVVYEQAITGAVTTSTNGVDYADFCFKLGLFTTEPVAAQELMDANAAVLQAVHDARARPQVAWSDRLADRFKIGSISTRSVRRAFCKLTQFSAGYYFTNGEHVEAVGALEDLLALGDAVGTHPTFASSLTAWACLGLPCRAVEEWGAGLSTVRGDAGSDIHAARRTRVLGLIPLLLDETSLRRGWVRACQGERSFPLATMEWAESAGAPRRSCRGRFMDLLEQPLLELDAARAMRYYTRAADAGTQPDWQSAIAAMPPEDVAPPSRLVRRKSRPFTQAGQSLNVRAVELFHRLLMRRRMAATALAIRLYVVDHGRRPSTLVELVPEYLSEVPVDLFSPDGAPLRYKPNAEDAVIYSVGRDGTDNGGVIADRGPVTDGDVLFYLDGRPEFRFPGA